MNWSESALSETLLSAFLLVNLSLTPAIVISGPVKAFAHLIQATLRIQFKRTPTTDIKISRGVCRDVFLFTSGTLRAICNKRVAKRNIEKHRRGREIKYIFKGCTTAEEPSNVNLC
jgi:hypothetical protein